VHETTGWTRRQVLGSAAAAAALPLAAGSAAAADRPGVVRPLAPSDLTVEITPYGPSQSTLNTIAGDLGRAARTQSFIRSSNYTLLSLRPIDDPSVTKADGPGAGIQTHYRATYYDYQNDRTVYAIGPIDGSTAPELISTRDQPVPSRAEFRRAVELLARDPRLGARVSSGGYVPYRPMPPIIPRGTLGAQAQRIVTVGMLPEPGQVGNEIVGVNMVTGEVIRFRGAAPVTSRAGPGATCGAPIDAGQVTDDSSAGAARVIIRRGSTVLWSMIALRPAASSGTNGSGVELRDVRYRNRLVLHQANLPMLNVYYEGNACGPYRDWANEEGRYRAVGTDRAPGFRLCTTRPTTILETEQDRGDYNGVAVFTDGDKVGMVSEIEAGWYRYNTSWEFGADGSLRPIFGFSAVENSCVCNRHYHHAYWRLDFDIEEAGNNSVFEFNNPPGPTGKKWTVLNTEIRRFRNYARRRKWFVLNERTNRGYQIIAPEDDRVAKDVDDWDNGQFGQGDLWALRMRARQFDDGAVAAGPPYIANINQWVNGESIRRTDVVVWYAAHFTHDVYNGQIETGHYVGPTLTPVRW
jgi:hypothetical protein